MLHCRVAGSARHVQGADSFRGVCDEFTAPVNAQAICPKADGFYRVIRLQEHKISIATGSNTIALEP